VIKINVGHLGVEYSRFRGTVETVLGVSFAAQILIRETVKEQPPQGRVVEWTQSARQVANAGMSSLSHDRRPAHPLSSVGPFGF
jgi:hypothetical protein